MGQNDDMYCNLDDLDDLDGHWDIEVTRYTLQHFFTTNRTLSNLQN